MPISVVCPNCKSRFNVSDQFAGQTGPCPKCKQPIKIPTPVAQSVVIHEPERPVATATGTGRAPTAPIKRRDRPVKWTAFALTATGAIAFMGGAFALRLVYGQPSGEGGGIPAWLLLAGAYAAAVPAVAIGYAAVRNRELEPYRGRPLMMRVLLCSAIYAGLWAVRGFIPAEQTAEMWQWFIIAPLFVTAGALASLAAFDLDWGTAAIHFSFYILFTSLLRWLAGFPPL
jgi:hypothetical protein